MDHNYSPKQFLFLTYEALESRNLAFKALKKQHKSQDFFRETVLKFLSDEIQIKAVMVCFSDLEGNLRSLDYDKKFLLTHFDGLTFDGSSVRGFSVQNESDLVLKIDWSSFYWVPADVFGAGKVIIFANVYDREGRLYMTDFRGRLQQFMEHLYTEKGIVCNVAPEIEGFLLKGVDVEQNFSRERGFDFVSSGGYYHALPQDPLRLFIDNVAEAKRAMGFQNEKDHPEVAPSQFELNYKYTDPIEACDNVLLYKLICRQVAKKMGYTACFLPKPIENINGSGMHLNISLVQNQQNLFYGKGEFGLSKIGMDFASAILYHAKSLCLILNASVNAYRRLDPKFEAPNEIKISNCDRGSMIRIPYADENSTRIEIRSVGPDVNPYLTVFSLLQIGLLGQQEDLVDTFKIVHQKREKLPGNIYDAMRYFKTSDVLIETLGKETHEKYLSLKETAANRSPKELGKTIKTEEVIYHHEVTNQLIWSRF